jgi:hypothetical protein
MSVCERSVHSHAQSCRPANVAVMVMMRVVEDSDHECKSVLENGRFSQPAVFRAFVSVDTR